MKGYARWFGTDTRCALRELKLSGVTVTPETENRITDAFHQRSRNRRRPKRAEGFTEFDTIESDEAFAVIVGYTTNGFPYGLPHAELRAENEDSSDE